MSETTGGPDWKEIGDALTAPFDPEKVDFRPQTGKGDSDKAQAVAYIDARVVMDRLDSAVGPGAWSFTYDPLVIANGEVQIAKGILTIHGITKEDIGEASNFAPSKGCVSDALKRAAALWGVGRYLYDIDSAWVTLENKRISQADIKRLRAKLPRPDGLGGPGGQITAPEPLPSYQQRPAKHSLRDRMKDLGFVDDKTQWRPWVMEVTGKSEEQLWGAGGGTTPEDMQKLKEACERLEAKAAQAQAAVRPA